MILTLIAAMAEDRVIGADNRIPWHLPDDLKRFKRLTLDHPLIMGRKTWDSLGRPLPKRTNIVLSRDAAFGPAGAVVVQTPEAALAAARTAPGGDQVFIIGGAQVYALYLPLAHVLQLTCVELACRGDAHFPAFDAGGWNRVASEQHPADERHACPFRFETWQRVGEPFPACPEPVVNRGVS